jgi:hypothetical protein
VESSIDQAVIAGVIPHVCGLPNSLQVSWGLSRCRNICARRSKSASHLGLVQISMATQPKAELEFSDDYRIISFNGQQLYLTPRQAAIVRVLHQRPYCEVSSPRGARFENACARCKRMYGSNSDHTDRQYWAVDSITASSTPCSRNQIESRPGVAA